MATVLAHVGDVGLVLKGTVKDENDTVVDISGAITKQIKIQNPSGTTTAKDGAFPAGETGVEGNLQYVTVAGDLSVRGDWRAQIYVVTASRTFHTSIHDFEVEAILA